MYHFQKFSTCRWLQRTPPSIQAIFHQATFKSSPLAEGYTSINTDHLPSDHSLDVPFSKVLHLQMATTNFSINTDHFTIKCISHAEFDWELL